ncbi:hypothetical protein [Herbaspirillum sp. RV1423]|uniref:hypothetical protein n=1 Tax=Herbaspirillum sp. RV1423 TaxID=1443993 RepID=UPI0004B3B857|nr:hypothetical protein [Herbaspirillum sp. RV1423]
MSGEIVETTARGKAVVAPDSGLTSLLSIADFPSKEMAEMMRTPKTSELMSRLERIAVPTDAASVPGQLTKNAEAKVKYRRSYFTTAPILEFVSAFGASVRDAYRTKQFGNPEYRRYLFETLALRVGDKLKPLPACIQEAAGTSFAVVAPVQCGKAALATALERCFPKPFKIENPPLEGLSEILVYPVIRLKYPRNRKLNGLLKDLRAAILAFSSDEKTKRSALSEMLEDESGDIAIATCILVNVGGIIIEGATGRKLDYVHTEEILEFLVKARDDAGIPVMLMCTPAFMHGVNSYGKTYASIFEGMTLHLDSLETSVQKGLAAQGSKIAERKQPEKPGEEKAFVKEFWDSGPSTKSKRMPGWLPQFVVDYCYGRQGWIAQCMEQLEIELGGAIAPDSLEKEIVEAIFEYRMKAMKPIRKVLEELETIGFINSKARFLNTVDFLPDEVFEMPRQENWYAILATGRQIKNDVIDE